MPVAKQTPQSIFWPLTAASIILTSISVYYGLPLGPCLTIATVIVCLLEPPVVYTGPKNKQGLPTPIGNEQYLARRYRACHTLLARLFIPGAHWAPGWPLSTIWLAGPVLAWLSLLAPVNTQVWTRWAVLYSPVLVSVWWWALVYSIRETAGDTPKPPVTLHHLRQATWVQKTITIVAATTAGIITLVLLAVVPLPWTPVFNPPIISHAIAASLLATSLTTSILLTDTATREWTETQQAAAKWETLWTSIYKQLPPIHTKHTILDVYTIDEFTLIPPTTAQELTPLSPKLPPLLGAGVNATILTTPALNQQQQPDYDTIDPQKIRVISWTREPDLTNPDTPLDIIRLALEAEIGAACDQLNPGGRVFATNIHPIHQTTPDTPTTDSRWWWWHQLIHKKPQTPTQNPWDTNNTTDSGTPAWEYTLIGIDETTLQTSILPNINLAGLDLLYDTRYTHVGILAQPGNIQPNPDTNLYRQVTTLKNGAYTGTRGFNQFWENIIEETNWRTRWGDIKEIGDTNPPTPQFHLQQTAPNPTRPNTTITSLPFATRQGIPPSIFLKLEPKIATVLGGAPLVSIVGYTPPGAPPGTRHPQGITLRWSHYPTPDTPTKLPPPRHSNDTTAQAWILAGLVNRGFDALKMPRPETINARPLTTNTTPKHLWEIRLRLYDTLTVPDVRRATMKLASALRCQWLRVTQNTSDPTDCIIVAGAHYRDTTISDPEDLAMLQALEWAWAWESCGVTSGGQLPTVTDSGFLENNSKIEQLEFTLPPGLGLEDARRVEKKLGGATGNQFIQIRASNTPGRITVLASPTDPMPFPAPLDYEQAVELEYPPFATGIDGTPVCWNPHSDPHLLVVGTTGGGKSTFVQTFLYPVIARGFEIIVIDPVKKAADFKCYLPWCAHVATDWQDTAATVKALKAEQDKRFEQYQAAGVQDIYHLPDGKRPPEVLIVVDEFNSAVAVDKPTPPADTSPATMEAYAQAQEAYAGSRTLGLIIGQIAAQGRSAGMHVMLAGQRVTAKTLEQVKGGEVLRTNLGRVLLGNATYGEKQSALRNPEQAPVLGDFVPKGRGVFESVTGTGVVIQTWYPPDGDPLLVLPEHLREVKPPAPGLVLDIEQFMANGDTGFEGQVVADDIGVIDLGLDLEDL